MIYYSPGCPFAIWFQYIELRCHREKKMPLIFHRIRITSAVVLDHNCKPSVISTHRLARESGGRVKIKKCMQEDSSTWRDVPFLESMRDRVQGFEFAIRPNSEGAHIAALWMTKQMHADLLRFCDVMFLLDAQKRQFNTSGFTYISP
jgi:hypothetical protein